MRVSEGMPFGMIAHIYHPEMFKEHEEVIVFTRFDIYQRITSIMAELDIINKISLNLDINEEWKLIGYWPKIMQSVHRIDMNMDLIFKKEPLQSYLDTYLYNNAQSSQKNNKLSETSKAFYFGQTKLDCEQWNGNSFKFSYKAKKYIKKL